MTKALETGKFEDPDSLAGRIPDGATVAVPSALSGDYSGVSMVVTRALIRRQARGLQLVCVPGSSLQADMLIGAGCVASIETGSVLLYEYGPASRFLEAQRAGAIEVRDSTCPAIHAALIAGEKGLPFMPVRGILGSDLVSHHDRDWRVIANPFARDDPILVVAALRPDVALLHVPLADRYGNAWIGRRSEFQTLARSAACTLVTFDAFHEGDLTLDDAMAPATVPSIYITALSHQPGGSWPLFGGPGRPEDTAHLQEYARMAATQSGFERYLARHVLELEGVGG